jgi:hypothetical protein
MHREQNPDGLDTKRAWKMRYAEPALSPIGNSILAVAAGTVQGGLKGAACLEAAGGGHTYTCGAYELDE